jgi:hypothetical protein
LYLVTTAPVRNSAVGPFYSSTVEACLSQNVDTAWTSCMLIDSSDGCDYKKHGALQPSYVRIDCRRQRRSRVNNCDRARHRKPNSYREISLEKVHRPRASSRDPRTRLSGLSFAKNRLAVVFAYPSDCLAGSQRCGERPCLHGLVEVERFHRERTAWLHSGDRRSCPESPYASSEICVAASGGPTV